MANSVAPAVVVSWKSSSSWITPLPARPMPRAIAASSSSAAVMVGVSAPSEVRWNSEREVEKPSAPASSPSSTSFAIAAMSAAVAGSRSTPRRPMTKTRSGACGTCVAKSMSQRFCASASRYSGKLSQFHGTPSRITISGMSSTPSMTLISVSRSSDRQGAKPTPQLPITTVVTPWPEEGEKRSSQVAWPS